MKNINWQMKIVSVLLISLFSVAAFAQKHGALNKITRTASFRKDTSALQDYIQDHTKYPEYSREHHIQGTVIIRVVINQTGDVEQASIMQSISFDCDNEALRVIKRLPRWQPAFYKGKPVKSVFLIPIKFQLE